MRSLSPGQLQIAIEPAAHALAFSWRESLGNTTFEQEKALKEEIFEALAAAAAQEYERQLRQRGLTESGGAL